MSDTVPLSAGRAYPKIHVLSVSEILGEAIRRIHDFDSVSSLFE